MKEKKNLFLIMVICMSTICVIRMAGLAADLLDFLLGIFIGIVVFGIGFMFLIIINLFFGAFYKMLLGNTRIYRGFKKLLNIWISFVLIMGFLGAFMLCLATWVANSAIYFFPQCMASGSFVGAWVYKNVLEKKVIDNININKEN